jgi:hypothetical protein
MSTKIYKLSPLKQLIDLNGDLVNFNIDFRVISKNREPFYMAIVDQKILDETKDLSYKLIENGETSGTISNDNGILQNYFMVLKADVPCECSVDIIPREIQKGIDIPIQTKESGNTNLYLIIGIIGIIVIGYLVYKYSRKDENGDREVSHRVGSDGVGSHRSVSNGFGSHKNLFENKKSNVLDRLKNIKI